MSIEKRVVEYNNCETYFISETKNKTESKTQNKTETDTSFWNLPFEIIAEIFGFLAPNDRSQYSVLSKKIKEINLNWDNFLYKNPILYRYAENEFPLRANDALYSYDATLMYKTAYRMFKNVDSFFYANIKIEGGVISLTPEESMPNDQPFSQNDLNIKTQLEFRKELKACIEDREKELAEIRDRLKNKKIALQNSEDTWLGYIASKIDYRIGFLSKITNLISYLVPSIKNELDKQNQLKKDIVYDLACIKFRSLDQLKKSYVDRLQETKIEHIRTSYKNETYSNANTVIITSLFGGTSKFKQLPILDISKKENCDLRYIDFYNENSSITFKELTSPVMRGVDNNGKLFFVLTNIRKNWKFKDLEEKVIQRGDTEIWCPHVFFQKDISGVEWDDAGTLPFRGYYTSISQGEFVKVAPPESNYYSIYERQGPPRALLEKTIQLAMAITPEKYMEFRLQEYKESRLQE